MSWIARQAKPSDLPYIVNSWVTHATRYLNQSMHSVKARVRDLLVRSDVTVLCLSDDEDAIIGFGVFEGSQVHMLYVRSSARRLGAARAILKGIDK